MKEELAELGYYIIRNKISPIWTNSLRIWLDDAFKSHREIQIKNNSEISTGGVALHVILTTPLFITFLEELESLGVLDEIKDNYFNSPFILNSFSALNNLPNEPNFSSNIHRDIRFFSGNCNLMLNCLVMLDDFTISNGATWILPKSHLSDIDPKESENLLGWMQITGKAGDIVVWNSNLLHKSGFNSTYNPRRALPITFSRSSLKQAIDLPRALGFENQYRFSDSLQQLLGYLSRIPESLEEFYQPKDKRFYKPNQD